MQCHYAHDEDDGQSQDEEAHPAQPRPSKIGIEESMATEETRPTLQQSGLPLFAGPSRNDSQTSSGTQSSAPLTSIQGGQWAPFGPVEPQSSAADFSAAIDDAALFSDMQTFFEIDSAPLDALASLPGPSLVDPLPSFQTLPEQPAVAATTVAGEAEIDAAIQSSFKDILWPGWPPSLPIPSLLGHLVETFFTTIPSVSRVIHRQTLLARISLPPTHADFPHSSLLHAICAVASRHSPAVYTRSVQEDIAKIAKDAKAAKGKGMVGAVPEDELCFSKRHAMHAFAAIKLNHVNARGLFDMLQALIIIGHWGQSLARWMDCWILVGTATRLVICLGLLDAHSHVQADNATPFRRTILAPPKDDVEREERRAAMWFLVLYDITLSASSGWTGALPMDEITTKFPAARTKFDKGVTIPENPQSFMSPDVYHNHPVADSFVMMSKGNMLLHRVIRLVRRCRRMEAHEWASVKDSAEFRQIENDLGMLSLTFPVALRDPVQYMQGAMKVIDADLISAHLLPHVAAINLHEPFADIKDPLCPSGTRLLAEARACLSVVYLVRSGISLFSVAGIKADVVPDYLFTATRTLALFYHRALETQDEVFARTLHTEITVFTHVFDGLAIRHSMGACHLAMIDTLMSSIEKETLGYTVANADNLLGLATQASVKGTTSIPSLSSRTTNVLITASYSTFKEIPCVAEHHPDASMINVLKAVMATGDPAQASGKFQEYLDEIRGYLKSSSSTSGNASGAGGGSNKGKGNAPAAGPEDPLGWMDLKSIGRLGDPLTTSSLLKP
ncbi:hypothetical protein B9479_005433 [Cryptococcus floricola]|uniref:Xylanolytic transcriptional activator regulatory domain-containing protein n=1 Tax=Cryptococcus floricola TaxID=2591691 RepID=A0A5D3AT66_9TREE|nr:hypothetical protein B9479_005433 [Cryptococcus floricola]